jgi:hypothetical protein
MNEFKIIGNLYVSEWNGNNANAGNDPTAPKKTISGVPNTGDNVILGSGFYDATLPPANLNLRRWRGDGT